VERPPVLYKYYSGSLQSIANLSDAKVWFGHPREFNDPFDCALDTVVSVADATDED
jgi:hypothetical protein